MELKVGLKAIFRAAHPVLKKIMPHEKLGKMEQGMAVLDRDSALLNHRGEALAQRAHWVAANAGRLPAFELENMTHDLASQLPSFENPRLELYRKPDISPFIAAKEKGAKNFLAEISNGCENQCIFCYAEASPKMFFMPYPMFLLVVDAVRNLGGKVSFMVHRTDVMLYRDALLGADFADLISAAKDVYEPHPCRGGVLISHGWPKNHKYGLSAGQKMRGMGISVDRLSVHLFHREFMDGAPAAALDEYAERFALAIDLLRPRLIDLRGGKHFDDPEIKGEYYKDCDNAPHQLSDEFIIDFYQQRIFPRLASDLRHAYPYGETEDWWWKDKSLVVVEVRKIGRGNGLDYTKRRLPLCDPSCKEMPGAVMITYPDGAYSIQEKGKLPRETGNLF